MKQSLIAPALLAIALLTVGINANGSASISAIDFSKTDINDIQDQLPAVLANTNMSLEDLKTLFSDKCIELAGKEKGEMAYKEIETAISTLTNCATDILNVTAIQVEIEEAGPKGELDVVFNKYCKKQPEALECIEAFNSKIAVCLDKDEKENLDAIMRIVRSLLSFVCYKGGDQIALFIAEEGPECLKSKKDDLQNCFNSTFAGYVPQNGTDDIKALPKFVMGTKQCEEIEDLEKCVVQKLEKCSEITPANIVESMFRFIKNETICHKTSYTAKQATGGVNGVVMIQQVGSISWLLGFSLLYPLIKFVQA